MIKIQKNTEIVIADLKGNMRRIWHGNATEYDRFRVAEIACMFPAIVGLGFIIFSPPNTIEGFIVVILGIMCNMTAQYIIKNKRIKMDTVF